MQFSRLFTASANDPYADLAFVPRESKITKTDGTVVFRMDVVAPEGWSQTAVDMLAQKYCRKAGVPASAAEVAEPGVPAWLRRRVPAADSPTGPETDARRVFDRIAGCWTYWGWKLGYFKPTDDQVVAYGPPRPPEYLDPVDGAAEENARAFYDEHRYILAHQLAAPNSPQWFNTGIHWAYGIAGDDEGRWAIDHSASSPAVSPTGDAYSRPNIGACYILNIEDTLLGPDGIMDFATREARIFKGGSGSGANYSPLRGANEPLSHGGRSSGLMSWLKGLDAFAGAIKSGGTNRRCARMIVLDADHPDVETFVDWKVREEKKVAAMVAGSRVLKQTVEAAYAAGLAGDAQRLAAAAAEAARAGVPYNLVDAAVKAAAEGEPCPAVPLLDTEYEGAAYETVSGQNANNSVRVTDEFMRLVEADGDWHLYWRTEKHKAACEGRDPDPCRTVKARDLWHRIARAAWECADPGVQFHDTCNDWNPVLNDYEIQATNPCSEFNFLNNTTCNLAALNLVAHYVPGDWTETVRRLRHSSDLLVAALDIVVSLAGYPSEPIAEGALKYRTIGLGYGNLGALIMRCGLAYDSPGGRGLAACLTAVVHYQATLTSARLAAELGAYPRYAANAEHQSRVVRNHTAYLLDQNYDGLRVAPIDPGTWWDDTPDPLRRAARELAARVRDEYDPAVGLRNAQLTLTQPTGTIGLVMDCDTLAAEPDFSLIKYKRLAGGGDLKLVNQSVRPALKTLGYADEAADRVVAYIDANATAEGSPDLKPEHLAVFDTAATGGHGVRSVGIDGHLLMMAVCQPVLSGSISKTCNLPREATVADVQRVYTKAWRLMIKAVALYRDYSKLSQPLKSRADAAPPAAQSAAPVRQGPPTRKSLPGRRTGYTQKFRVPGHKLYLTTGEYPGGALGEIFLTCHKEGSAFRSVLNAFAQAVSIGLQYGVPLEEFVDAFTFTRFEPGGPVGGHDRLKQCTSLLDAVFRDLAIQYLGRDDLAHVPAETGPTSAVPMPPPPRPAETKYEGTPCVVCGAMRMVRDGKCLCCQACGATTGCA